MENSEEMQDLERRFMNAHTGKSAERIRNKMIALREKEEKDEFNATLKKNVEQFNEDMKVLKEEYKFWWDYTKMLDNAISCLVCDYQKGDFERIEKFYNTIIKKVDKQIKSNEDFIAKN